jgi:hypothetical protein
VIKHSTSKKDAEMYKKVAQKVMATEFCRRTGLATKLHYAQNNMYSMKNIHTKIATPSPTGAP